MSTQDKYVIQISDEPDPTSYYTHMMTEYAFATTYDVSKATKFNENEIDDILKTVRTIAKENNCTGSEYVINKRLTLPKSDSKTMRIVHNNGGYAVRREATQLYLMNIKPLTWHSIKAQAMFFKTRHEAESAKQQVSNNE